MIKAVMMMNTQGKPRLAKFYDYMVRCLLRYVFQFRFLRSKWPIL